MSQSMSHSTSHSIEENKRFLTSLFSGSFPGHGLIFSAMREDLWGLGDFTTSDRPVADWIPYYVASYRAALKYHEELGDDSVPYVNMNTNTGIFASAFGCKFHVYSDKYQTNACALPCVHSVEEADALPEASLNAPALSRYFELVSKLRQELGPEVPISVPDIQSPFDIAALVWHKEGMLPAMLDEPDAVHRLVAKCSRLLTAFFDAFMALPGEINLCHCPEAWAPPTLGVWLSEDEVGSISEVMFEAFCLPTLIDLSKRYGGLIVHCCAEADHQYPGFKKIPNLRGLNRVWTSKGPMPAIKTFSGDTVLIVAWTGEDGVNQLLDMALPNTRFLFNFSGYDLDTAKRVNERMRERCPRLPVER